MPFVYMLHCADGTYYIGSTSDLARRLHAHNYLKAGAHYTKTRRPVGLIFLEEYASLREAKQREAKLKKLSREQKTRLCFGVS